MGAAATPLATPMSYAGPGNADFATAAEFMAKPVTETTAAPAEPLPLTTQSAPPRAKRHSRRPEWKAGVTPMLLLRTRGLPTASLLYVILLLILLAEVVLTLNAK